MSVPLAFSSVGPPYWNDAPVLVIGTGPSLKGFDLSRLRGLGHVLGINEAWRDLPFADACFTVDTTFLWRRKRELTALARRMPFYAAIPATTTQSHIPDPKFAHVDGAIYLERLTKCGPMSTNPSAIEAGGHSGFGAVNLADLKRGKLIYLFGFDYTAGHYCDDRYPDQPNNLRYLRGWMGNFNTALPGLKARGVSVINASPKSNMTTFPRITLDQAMAELEALRLKRTPQSILA